ncbi:LOW QUALITY PROTEIN: hypothetical protein CsSME_00000548 [Camellia sinensis var. sinensis]
MVPGNRPERPPSNRPERTSRKLAATDSTPRSPKAQP